MLKSIVASLLSMAAHSEECAGNTEATSMLQTMRRDEIQKSEASAEQDANDILAMFDAISEDPAPKVQMLSALPMDHRVALWQRPASPQVPQILLQKFKSMSQ